MAIVSRNRLNESSIFSICESDSNIMQQFSRLSTVMSGPLALDILCNYL